MTQFGPYKLLRHLAAGGMGEIYLAKLERGEGFEKLVVIKRILPQLSRDPAFVEMFQREACIAAQLGHENVVHIFDYGQHDHDSFIAMEYVHGRDLRTLLDAAQARKEFLPAPVVVALLTRVCAGLDYAHRRTDLQGRRLGIVHRDVSPQNILVSYEGELKLTDFGLAQRRSVDASVEGQVQGKFAYMSPEQSYGDPLDPRSDIFSLGVVAYELLCGQRPFQGPDAPSMIRALRKGDYAPASALRPDLPPSLDLILARALAAEPTDRYPDARAMRSALDELARQHAWTAGPEQIAALVARLCPDTDPFLLPRRASNTLAAGLPASALDRTASALAPIHDLSPPDPSLDEPAPIPTEPALAPARAATPARPTTPEPPAALPSPPSATPAEAPSPAPNSVWRWLLGAAAVLVVVGVVGFFSGVKPTPAPNKDWPPQTEATPTASQLLEPEAPLGHVLLDVTPHDARVWLNDEPPLTPNPQGRFEFHRPPGKLKLHLARDGYQTVTREIEVPTRSTLSHSIELRPLPVRVEVKPSRPAQGRVVLEADGDFRTECSLPCEARVPTPGEVRVKVSLDASPHAPPWGAARATKPGERVTFLVPVEAPPPEPEARLRASITGKTPEGAPLRASLLDANLLRHPQGAGRQKLPTGQTVTLRYEFVPGTRRLQVSLASDPWSNLTLDGAPAGQTPLVGREISPGNHRLVLVEHGLTVSLRYSLVLE